MIEIYGKEQCPFCVQAKQLCETRNYPFVYKQLGQDFMREEVMQLFPEARTFPQIKVNGTAIGGYGEFKKYIEETGYNGTGYE
jgi:glutaredoxin